MNILDLLAPQPTSPRIQAAIDHTIAKIDAVFAGKPKRKARLRTRSIIGDKG